MISHYTMNDYDYNTFRDAMIEFFMKSSYILFPGLIPDVCTLPEKKI